MTDKTKCHMLKALRHIIYSSAITAQRMWLAAVSEGEDVMKSDYIRVLSEVESKLYEITDKLEEAYRQMCK